MSKNCAHVICNECMKAYVDSNLASSFSNAGKFQCPACENDLELALIVNFASNANLIDTFVKNTIERVIFVLNNYKWCPAPYCSKIIQVDLNSNPFGTVSCTCGFKMCLKCNNPPHFPAKCSQIANYYQELKINNDFWDPLDRRYESTGKKCPKCDSFMEKNGGCNHMICSVCHHQFCWECHAPWLNHSICLKQVEETKHNLEKERRSFGDNKFARYQNSLDHRQKRVPEERDILARNAKRLLNSIKSFNLESKKKENLMERILRNYVNLKPKKEKRLEIL